MTLALFEASDVLVSTLVDVIAVTVPLILQPLSLVLRALLVHTEAQTKALSVQEVALIGVTTSCQVFTIALKLFGVAQVLPFVSG